MNVPVVRIKATNKEERRGFPFHYGLRLQHLKKLKIIELKGLKSKPRLR